MSQLSSRSKRNPRRSNSNRRSLVRIQQWLSQVDKVVRPWSPTLGNKPSLNMSASQMVSKDSKMRMKMPKTLMLNQQKSSGRNWRRSSWTLSQNSWTHSTTELVTDLNSINWYKLPLNHARRVDRWHPVSLRLVAHRIIDRIWRPEIDSQGTRTKETLKCHALHSKTSDQQATVRLLHVAMSLSLISNQTKMRLRISKLFRAWGLTRSVTCHGKEWLTSTTGLKWAVWSRDRHSWWTWMDRQSSW